MAKAELKLKASDFVHLHVHTQYSLLDGLTKVPALTDKVKQMGMEAVAITDHGTMSGAIEFYKEAVSADIKPLVGMEAYVSPRALADKDPAFDKQYYHLTLLATNFTGYQNLMKLATLASLEGFYYKPRIDRQTLAAHSDGIIALSGCIGGELSDALRQGQQTKAQQIIAWYKEVFKDRYYIELADHGHPKHLSAWADQTRVNQQLLALAKQYELPAVVTGDAHYLNHEDKDAHEALLCIQTGAFVADENRFSLKDFQLHVADPAEIISRWGREHPELILNTKKIADRCNLKLEFDKILIPKFPTPAGETEKTLLQKQVWQGLVWRYQALSRAGAAAISVPAAKKMLSPEIVQRAEFELDVVDRMGFNGYFLIVADFINWGKDRGIVFGPGRGSAASSIMAYATRITEIEPLKYDLLFERFLNPDRISMPDMDIDIQDNRRDEVINYCIEKYGRDRVANIVTFGRMAARNSVRDVARVLQVPYAEADRLAKMIPLPIQGRHTSLSQHLKEVAELKAEQANNPAASRVFELAIKLEGTIRSHGVHAAGVVIAPDDIVEFVPLEMAQKGVVATQYSMLPIEDLGLLKIDFLGLSNLTTIKNALRIIKKVYGKDIDISSVPMDDEKTFKLLQAGETTGVFQLESAGMRRYLKQLKPTVFEDIIAMVALYRPGPMQWIEDFISRKHGQKQITYLHPVMEAALKNTYGVIVYQEQVMQISKDLCGFTGGQADTLRKGIAKKIPEVLAKMKKQFIEGAVSHSGADKKAMERFWVQLEEFAAYCFNKVHSACYGLIAYQTAYLKAHFPTAFMAALMTSDYDNIDRLAIEITECQHMGLEVLPPDINQSFHEFAVVPNTVQIRFGLDAIKNVGFGAVEEILRARLALGGRFESLEAYSKEVDPRIVNRKALESLIKAGAFDSFAERFSLVNNIDGILALSNQFHKNVASGQTEMFGDMAGQVMTAKFKLEVSDSEEISDSIQLEWERQLLGIYLTKHPLASYEKLLADQTMPITSLASASEGSSVKVGGVITEIREITTKTGAKMAFVKLADISAEIEIVVFPKVYKHSFDVWQRDKVVIVAGEIGRGRAGSGSEMSLLAREVKTVNLDEAANYQPTRSSKSAEAVAQASPRLYIKLSDPKNESSLVTLKKKLDGHQGETEVVLVTGQNTQRKIIKLPQTVSVNEQSLRDIASIFGSTNVVVK
ncbi:MAG: DNA polymerase III subunit alpha [Candidatus Saccharimonadales bacterium]